MEQQGESWYVRQMYPRAAVLYGESNARSTGLVERLDRVHENSVSIR